MEVVSETGLHWRISLSIVMGVTWLVSLILWVSFYAEDFSIYQNFAVFIASVLIVGGVLGAVWIPWGMKHGF